MKKFIFLILAAIAAQSAFAAGTKIGDLYYTLDSSTKTAEVTYSTSSSPSSTSPSYSKLVNVVIPETVTSPSTGIVYKVTSIGKNAFYYSPLQNIVIPNSVTSIGEAAFFYSSLQSVDIPNSVTSIGESAFKSCFSLQSVVIPNSVNSIGERAFSYTSLQSVVIPNSVTSIGSFTFHHCTSLQSVVIPNSVTTIDHQAFEECTSLQSVFFPNSVKVIAFRAFYNCSSLQYVVFESETPPTLGSSSGYTENFKGTPNSMVVLVPFGAKSAYSSLDYLKNKEQIEGFVANNNCSSFIYNYVSEKTVLVYWTKLSILPPGIINLDSQVEYKGKKYTIVGIPEAGFKDQTVIKSITLPETLQFIGANAFSGCTGIQELNIPGSVTSIGENAFSKTTALKSVYLERGSDELKVTTPFSGSPVETLFLGRDVNGTLGITSSLKTLTVGSNVSYIYNNSFKNCSALQSVEFFNGNLKKIGTSAFEGCRSLSTVSIPNTVETVGASAFRECATLASATLPIKLTAIPDYLFYGAPLKEISLPAGITSIGTGAFYSNAFSSLEIPEGVTEIRAQAFENGSLQKVELSSSLKKIGASAFKATQLEEIELPDNVAELGDNVFSHCLKLQSVKLSQNLSAIPSYAFSDCGLLNEVSIQNNVKSINSYAFSGCVSLSEVEFPAGITSIGNYAFNGCNALLEVTLPSTLTDLGGYAFYNCELLQEVTIPATAKNIGSHAFDECNNLFAVNSLATTPPTCADDYGFSTNTFSKAVLWVPGDAREDYMTYKCWKKFKNIDALTAVTAIEITGPSHIMHLNKTMELTATLTPQNSSAANLTWSSSNTRVATVDNSGLVKAVGPGYAVISAKTKDIIVAEGNFELTVEEYELGDSNESEDVTITDAVNIASYVMGDNPDVFNFNASDVNRSNTITLADASGVISIVLDNPYSVATSNRMKAPAAYSDKLIAGNVSFGADATALVPVTLESSNTYVALQADVTATGALTVTDVVPAAAIEDSHSLISKRIDDNTIRIVLYSPALNNLPESAPLFEVKVSGDPSQKGAVAISNILATDTNLKEFSIGFEGGVYEGGSSGIGSIYSGYTVTAEGGVLTICGAEGNRINVFSTTGLLVASKSDASDVETFALTKGLYIVAIGSHVEKVVVK